MSLSHFVDISPIHKHICDDEKIAIEVFGKPHNFRHLSQKPELLQSVLYRAHEYGVSRLFLPQVSLFNAKIADAVDQFQRCQIVLETEIREECYVDGMLIRSGEAFFVASADCPTLVFSSLNKDYVVACHAGLRCLVDYSRVYHDGKIRTHQSVVDRALEFFRGDERNVNVRLFCGIGAQAMCYSVYHERHGVRNETLVKYLFNEWGGECFAPYIKDEKLTRPQTLEPCLKGHVDLFGLVRAQAEKKGVRRDRVFSDGVCTYTDGIGSHGGKFWSHKRQMEMGVMSEEGKRNGVLVCCRG